MDESQIFAIAVKLATGAERAAYLDQACAGSPQLRANVEALLKAHATNPSFLERPASLLAGTLNAVETPAGTAMQPDGLAVAGTLLAGRYKLIEPIGEGGMGTVWMAEQVEPVKRLVAVKLVKQGLDSKQVLARFDAERQALALMDHPNIAKVLDAGTTAAEPVGSGVRAGGSGRPFFVMELVKGVPITHYCDARRLTPRQRLELVVPVCHAIQHAHQKGVIHRDIKPSNVLVTMYDDRPVPKVIDFGVAKAMGQNLTEATLHTGFGAVVGTLEYMSPEQASFNQLDVDTRSDIYSLGVLLYELLAGSPPFSRQELEKAGLLEMLRVIREQEPSKPSTKLSSSATLPTLSANRGMEPARLTKLIRGDLDWIVMKALEKDRSRRYETASSLAHDVLRYLADEPIVARPPSSWYRVRKFVRRNKGQVVAATIIILLLVAGVCGTTIGLVAALNESDLKEDALNSAIENANRAREQQRLATEHEAIARTVSDFFQNDLLLQAASEEQVDRGEEANPDLKVREVLDRAAARIGNRFQDQPIVEAAIRYAIGRAYKGLGEARLAVPHAERSVELHTAVLGRQHVTTLKSMAVLAMIYAEDGQFQRAFTLCEETWQLRKTTLGANDNATLNSMLNLASIHRDLGQTNRAIELLEDVLTRRQANYGANHVSVIICQHNLAEVYEDASRLGDAIRLYEAVLKEWTDRFGINHPKTLACRHNLTIAYTRHLELAKAAALAEDTLRVSRSVFGPDHPRTYAAMGVLGKVRLGADDVEQAVPLFEAMLQGYRAKRGDDHPHTLGAMVNLAQAFMRAGKHAQALPLLQTALAKSQARLGMEHPQTLTAAVVLGRCQVQAGQIEQAMPLLEQTFILRRKRSGADHPETLTAQSELAAALVLAQPWEKGRDLYEKTLAKQRLRPKSQSLLLTLNHLGAAYQDHGQHAKARPLLEESLHETRTYFGADHLNTATALNNLGQVYMDLGLLMKAVPLLEQALAIREAKLGRDDAETLKTAHNLGASHFHEGQLDAAIRLFEPTLVAKKARLGPDHPATLDTLRALAFTYIDAERPQDAIPLLEELFQTRKKTLPAGDPDIFAAMNSLAIGYTTVGRIADAVPLFEEALAKLTESLGPNHAQTRSARRSLEAAKLVPSRETQYQEMLAAKGPDDPATLAARLQLGRAMCSARIPSGEDHLQAVYDSRRRLSGAEHAQTLNALLILGSIRLDHRKYRQAELTFRELHDTLQRSDSNSWQVPFVQSLIGGCLLGQKKFAEAELLLLQGYDGMKQREAEIPARSKHQLPDAAKRLVKLYESLEQPEKAAAWRAKLPPKPPGSEPQQP